MRAEISDKEIIEELKKYGEEIPIQEAKKIIQKLSFVKRGTAYSELTVNNRLKALERIGLIERTNGNIRLKV